MLLCSRVLDFGSDLGFDWLWVKFFEKEVEKKERVAVRNGELSTREASIQGVDHNDLVLKHGTMSLSNMHNKDTSHESEQNGNSSTGITDAYGVCEINTSRQGCENSQ